MSTDTLEFPPIDTAPRADVATVDAAAQDLAKIDLQAVALAQFNGARADAAKAKATLTGVVHDLSTPTKLADAKSLRHRLIKVPLAEARATSTALKSKLTAVSKAVGAELAAIESDFEEAEKLITPQIDAAQAKLDAEREAARLKEEARVQAHREALAKLAAPAEKAAGPDMTAERIATGIKLVEAIVIDRAAWEEFADQAEEQKAVTLERMRKLHAQAVAAEAEAARLAAEKAEAERKAAELKAQEEKLAAERAELERKQAEFRAQQEAAAQAQREREAVERSQAEAKAKKDREDARILEEAAKAAAPGFKARKPLPDGVTAGASVNDSGQWYAADGTFMNPDGTRSIFDDVDEDSEIEFAPNPITQDAQESGSMPETPGQCASSEAESAQASPSGSGTAVLAEKSTVSSVAPAPEVRAFPAPAVAANEVDAITLKLGELWDALGLTDREAFLASLGFPATPASKGTGKLYLASKLPDICMAISQHFAELAGQKKAA